MNFLHEEDFPTLVEAGFISVKHGSGQLAGKLFRAAQILRPQHSAPALGFGFIAMNAMRLEEARHLFGSVLKQEPDNALAKVLLGFSYLISKFTSFDKSGRVQGKKEEIRNWAEDGERLIHEALQSSKDQGVHSLGEAALELSKRITQYQTTPMK